jgi:hypothetical protein
MVHKQVQPGETHWLDLFALYGSVIVLFYWPPSGVRSKLEIEGAWMIA